MGSRSSRADLSIIAQAVGQFAFHAELLDHIYVLVQRLPDIDGLENAIFYSLEHALHRCHMAAALIRRIFQSMESDLNAQAEDISDECTEEIDAITQRAISTSSIAVEVRGAVPSIAINMLRANAELLRMYERVLEEVNGVSAAQLEAAQFKLQTLAFSGLLDPPPDDLSREAALRAAIGPVTRQSPMEQNPAGEKPRFLQVVDVPTSLPELVQDFCKVFRCLDDARMTAALKFFIVSLSRASYWARGDGKNVELLHLQRIGNLQNMKQDIGHLPSMHPWFVETISVIYRRLALLQALLVEVSTTADA